MGLRDAYINYNVFKYNESISDIIAEIIKPLFQHLGFNYFSYCMFFEGSQYVSISNHLHLYEPFSRKDLDKSLFPDTLALEEDEKRVVFWDLYPKDPLVQHMREYNYCYWVSVFYKKNNFIHKWNFAADRENCNISNIYTNNMNLIDKFIFFFNKKIENLIDINDKSKLATYKNGYKLELNSRDKVDESVYNQFVRDIAFQKYPLSVDNQNVYLTSTQLQCLALLPEGKNIKEVANLKKISPRTVETHLNSIKNKVNVSNKSKLIEKFNHSIYNAFGGIL